MPVEGLFSQDSIVTFAPCPAFARICETGHRSMQISRLAGIEVFRISEDIPAQSSYVARVCLFEVYVSEFHAWVWDEDPSEPFFNILEISASTEIIKATRESTRGSTCDIV